MRILNLGAGVQSTALLLLILEGAEHADAAIFADTGAEPAAVYAHLERLEAAAAGHLPIYRVSAGDLRTAALGVGRTRLTSLPAYLQQPDGRPGMARRQCTRDYKIRPIRRKVRELMAAAGVRRAVQLFGISFDELERMRSSDAPTILEHAYPLVERRWTRADCVAYLERRGWTAPRSACTFCPFHADAEWRDMRDHRPDEWADAQAFELELQQAARRFLRGSIYLHRQRVPLAQVDLRTPADHGQLELECGGSCFT
jgi:hypothetical protein